MYTSGVILGDFWENIISLGPTLESNVEFLEFTLMVNQTLLELELNHSVKFP